MVVVLMRTSRTAGGENRTEQNGGGEEGLWLVRILDKMASRIIINKTRRTHWHYCNIAILLLPTIIITYYIHDGQVRRTSALQCAALASLQQPRGTCRYNVLDTKDKLSRLFDLPLHTSIKVGVVLGLLLLPLLLPAATCADCPQHDHEAHTNNHVARACVFYFLVGCCFLLIYE